VIGAAKRAAAAAARRGKLSVLARLQLGLEALYRVETRLDVESFLIDEERRRHAGVARAPREQLLVSESDDELQLALFVDSAALANLELHDPARGLHDDNFADFCLAVEGVSHFIYVALCAAAERSVSALELELQAEVDKFACCVLLANAGAGAGADLDGRALLGRLFDDVIFAADLDDDEHDRYRTANAAARRYAVMLARQFVTADRVSDMLGELRCFYRLDLGGKLDRIGRLG
jgi:hypothetical protein